MDDKQEDNWRSLIAGHIQDDSLNAAFEGASHQLAQYIGSSLVTAISLDFQNPSALIKQHKWINFEPSILQLLHWALVKYNNRHNLTSKVLQKCFNYIESAPLLSILDDFLPNLNDFFLTIESSSSDTGTNDVNASYITALEMYCLLKQRLLDVQQNWRKIADSALSNHGDYKKFAENYRSTIETTLKQMVEELQEILHSYGSGENVPRFVQLCRKLELSEKEQDALSYIFMQNVGVLFGKLHSCFSPLTSSSSLGGSRQSSVALAAASFAQFTSKELLDFFDDGRKHLKQELLEPEDEFSSLQTSNFIKMPTTVLRACCGCTLSADDLYKIDKTAMAEVMTTTEQEKQVLPDEVEAILKEVGEGGVSDDDEEELTAELEDILKSCDQIQSKVKGETEVLEANKEEAEDNGAISKSSPYTSDLEYLEDNFQLIETLAKAMKLEQNDDSLMFRADQRKPEAVIRELKAKARSLRAKIEKRMEVTQKQGDWLPRLERLAGLRGLDGFEKNVLLILTGSMVSKNLRSTGNPNDYVLGRNLSIGALISLLCDGLQEQIQSRTYFYKNSKLVSEGLVHVSDPPLLSRGNFLDSVVELDRRLLDYIVGLDTEINELVDGSDLYTPDVTLKDVALPHEHREMLMNIFQSFDQFQKTCKDLGLSTKGASKGLCLLFYGPSGTGKTMTANAVASYLGKKVLLVTVSALMERELTKELLRFLFREAKIHNAVLFFDECESLFESRDTRPNPTLGVLLTEIEQYDGVIILATNRHQDLDEAMHRRIQLALPFSVPDYALRVEIWKSHVPTSIAGKDIDWTNLALSHELTGGLISNAVLSAISLALKECTNDTKPILNEEHLNLGAKLQLRGLLEMVDFERRVIPTFGLKDLVLEESVQQQLKLILNSGKTQKFISAQWGFGSHDNVAHSSGLACLVCGGPGIGKTAIAHALAYELGQPIKEANCTELLAHSVTVSPRTSRGVAAFFRDAQKANAIVVLDGTEILLSNISTPLMSGYVGCEHYTLAHQIEHFVGVVILTSRKDVGHLDLTRLPKLRHVINLSPPRTELRERLWRLLVPRKAPVAKDIKYDRLAKSYEFTGGEIASVICQAAELCAMVTNNSPVISEEVLMETAEEEIKKRVQRTTYLPAMFQ